MNDGTYAVVPTADDTRIPDGIIIDGVHWQLSGQPPVAKTKGWGNLSFLYQR